MPGANLHGHADDALQPYGQLFARRVSHYSNPEDIQNPAVKPFAIQNAILNSNERHYLRVRFFSYVSKSSLLRLDSQRSCSEGGCR